MTLIATIEALLNDVEDVFAEDFAAQQALISNFLQSADNGMIRVYVPSSSGFGHQATTVLIMNRLIALGFNHNYQVVYDNGADGATGRKLAKLIPGFDPNGADSQDVEINEATTATMIKLSYFKTHIADYDVVNFGITGGFDTNATNLADAPAVDGNSKGVKVNFFLKLQPFQWNKQNAIQRSGQAQAAFTLLEAQEALGNASFIKRGYYVAPAQAPPQADFGADEAKYAAYQAIIAACTGAEANVNLLPAYGIGDSPDFPGFVEANPNIRPENVLLYVITAIRYAQQFSAVPVLQRGAIIVIIATISDGSYANLNTLLSGIGAAGRNQAVDRLNQFVTDVGAVVGDDISECSVEVINYDSAQLADKIAVLQGGGGANKILVVKMAGLPLSAFDYIYARSSLPSLLEGKGTANLVLNLNTPYLNILKDNNVVYPTLPLAAAENGERAVQCNNAVLDFRDSAVTTNGKLPAEGLVLNPDPSVGLTQTAMYKIAELTREAYTADNPLQTYFANLQTFFQNQQEDKLFLSLLFFLSYVNGLDD